MESSRQSTVDSSQVDSGRVGSGRVEWSRFKSSHGVDVPVHGVIQVGFRPHPTGAITTTLLLRPISPCQPTQAMAGPVFSYVWNPYPALPGVVYNFYGYVYPDFGYLDPFRPASLPTITGLQCYGATYQVMIARDNTTVVSYINKQGGTHSHTLLHLVVDL